MLKRGSYPLAHMSQVLGRDETAQEIAKHFGGSCVAHMLTDEQHKDRLDGKPGTGLPYRFLVYSAYSSAMSWTAFFTREAMQRFLDAYGCKLDREPVPGEVFHIMFPASDAAFAPLADDGRDYDGGAPDPDHAAMYQR